MGLVKRTYVDGETVITAENMNAIQDELLRLGVSEGSLWNSVTSAGTKASNALDNEAAAYNYHLQYHVGDYCLYQQKLYRCTVETPAAGETWNSSHWTAVTVGDEMIETASELSELRNTLNHMENGVNENMTAGNAMQLDSFVYAEDQVPYLFRQTGGGVNAGTREIDTIVGGTVVWNQLVNSGMASVTVPNGHKYLSRIDSVVSIGTSTGTEISINDATQDNIFDLTQMFGAAIADRAYALEQATAGSGIAWLKSTGFFTQDYYPYDAGTLKSVEGLQSHDMAGFNQWDEECERCNIDWSTKQFTPNASGGRLASKNFIPVISGQTYFITKYTDNYIAGYSDVNANGIGITTTAGVFTIPDNIRYIKFGVDVTNYGTTYKNDICINLSKTTGTPKNGDYVPYDGHTYPLDSDLELRGIPKLENNKLVYDGDVYESSGNVQRRYGIVDLGTLEWTAWDKGRVYSASLESLIKNTYAGDIAKIVSNKYQTARAIDIAGDESLIAVGINGAYVVVRTGDSNNPTGYLVYELATPTTETADPFQTPQICDPSGTEEYVTTGIVPVGHLTKYPEDLRAKIEGLPWNLSMIAPIENGTTASQAYTTGQYFLHNDLFCKALTSIASGATFTLNTNYAVTTVAAELYAAINS